MYNVSEAYRTAANSNSRNVVIRAEFRTKTYIESEGKYRWQFRENQYSYGNLLSAKIVEGQTTGAFRLGDTICPVLDISVARGCTVYNDDMIDVYVSFDNGKEWQKLTGDFFVDTVDRDRQSIKIRAYGFMLQLSKSYNSKLTFPATEDDVLREMLAINTVDVGYQLLTNANIAEKPVKGEAEDGSTLYYTRREMYGYLAAANGGNAYINNANQLCFSTPRETGETFTHEQVISETLTPPQTVEHIQWNTSGLSYSLGDDYAENSLEFYNPIVFSVNEQVLHFLEQALIGFTLDGAVIKKNGCGYYELGDITTYIDIVGAQHKMLIMGIVYDFSGGYFSETLYSLTNTESQRTYAGQQVVSNQIGGGQATFGGVSEIAKKLQSDGSTCYAVTSGTDEVDICNGDTGATFPLKIRNQSSFSAGPKLSIDVAGLGITIAPGANNTDYSVVITGGNGATISFDPMLGLRANTNGFTLEATGEQFSWSSSATAGKISVGNGEFTVNTGTDNLKLSNGKLVINSEQIN